MKKRNDGHTILAAGLHLVATPIGAARDITLNALDILRYADVIAAEDTRRIRQLLNIHDIQLAGRKLLTYNDHSDAESRSRLVDLAVGGKSVALVSDAGTPLIADPGFQLVRAFLDAGLPIAQAPGASAIVAALSVASQPTDKFLFGGFLPRKPSRRREALEQLADVRATLVFFEAPNRVVPTLEDMSATFGSERPATVCRELTKVHEEVVRSSLSQLSATFAAREKAKGEFVIVVGPSSSRKVVGSARLDQLLRPLLKVMSVKDASGLAAELLELPRRQVYSQGHRSEPRRRLDSLDSKLPIPSRTRSHGFDARGIVPKTRFAVP